MGSALSILDFLTLGSTLSLRAGVRVGSSLSMFGVARLGSSLSLLDFATLGSSLSLRNFLRVGSTVSIFGSMRLGSTLSVVGDVSLGNTLSINTIIADTVKHHAGLSKLEITENKIEMWAGPAPSQRSLTVTGDGGTLHGAWSSDATVTTSDRRLKRNIEPLYRTIAQQASERGGVPVPGVPSPRDQPIGWLLRELRPVSFNFKHGPEAKHLKFGFIAQELETVFPNLVRTIGKDDTKAVASQDLIAVLTLALQTLQKEFDDARRELEEQRMRVARLEQAVFANKQPEEVHV
eukprot:CAMPEP_0176116456 /NCGR_PEP_ID=MMETSP0120_2-20121206/58494_1 /TAXON_ID=160619 /ORGANISM="Kryptoperidinium foliaceum, Strain CCMP 1326" /LENGTH=291 /DNA_ID=CAMNT_0017450721 /DNA_START=206 /DNA_END=1081 /DNA_ORIENTATION=-